MVGETERIFPGIGQKSGEMLRAAEIHWRDIAKNHRTSLLLALDEAEKISNSIF
jgi:hypothetical protein